MTGQDSEQRECPGVVANKISVFGGCQDFRRVIRRTPGGEHGGGGDGGKNAKTPYCHALILARLFRRRGTGEEGGIRYRRYLRLGGGVSFLAFAALD